MKSNDDYLTKKKYIIGTRVVEGLGQVPYNEIFVRVGGHGRIVCGVDVATEKHALPSLEDGCGLPLALFVRTCSFGHLVSMLRIRARLRHAWGDKHVLTIPLLLITPEDGIRVLTNDLQNQLWKIAASDLNPFQNSTIAYKTTIDNTHEASFQQKVEELLDLDESIREILTPEELARLAGGFGATDDSIQAILQQVMENDRKLNNTHKERIGEKSHKLQDTVNEGLAAAVRSGDYHTSRQLLIVYSLVASSPQDTDDEHNFENTYHTDSGERTDPEGKLNSKYASRMMSLDRDADSMKKDMALVRKGNVTDLSSGMMAPPPPPPLDTERLRSATNSDGLLAVLGAAQVLKAMQDGSAKQRVQEAIQAVDEWVQYGEQSMAFRISSWYDQKAGKFFWVTKSFIRRAYCLLIV
jgi:hypothetical protein